MSERIHVLKTYKTYVNGQFPRSESGKTFRILNKSGRHIANACRCTRKDIRDAVLAARKAGPAWEKRSAYNRGQILYRIAEMLEGRKHQFAEELLAAESCSKNSQAFLEVETAIDRLIYFAGWTDKISQVFGTINPVASSHFNFSMPEPTGVTGIISPENNPLLSVVSLLAPVICSGNTAVLLAPETNPTSAITLGEVLHSSDVPAGVVNILSGFHQEMLPALASHMDVNAVFNASDKTEFKELIDEHAALNIKRVKHYSANWLHQTSEDPYLITAFMETKTTWHPVGS